MEVSEEAGTQSKAVEGIIEDSEKCWEFFCSDDYQYSSSEVRKQLWYLAKMAYVSFSHLKGEFKENARAMDATQRDDSTTAMKKVSTTTEELQEVSTTTEELQEVSTATEEVQEVSTTTEELQEVSTTNEELQQVSTTTEGLQEVSTTIEELQEASTTKQVQEVSTTALMEDQFISNILKAMQRITPNLRYKPRHLRRKKFKVVPYEFASIWRNLHSIFNEKEAPNYIQESALPQVAWEKVNKGALKKFPTPSLFPVSSVSPEASLYGKCCSCPQFERGRPSPCSCPTKFEKRNPFGSLPGFVTNVGIVPVPATPLFGYIWDQDKTDWILHAEVLHHGYQDQRSDSYRRSRPPQRRRTRGSPRRRR